MKNIVILISFMFITLTSCNLNNNPPIEEPEDPKAKGFYECFINGESFSAKGPNGANQFSPNPHFRLTELSGSFAHNIYNEINYQTFDLYVNGINQTGIYNVHDSSYFGLEVDGVFTKYKLLKSEKHQLIITQFDDEFDIIVGTYELSYINIGLVDTLRVYGSFDVHYTL